MTAPIITLRARERVLRLGDRPWLMGIVNATPDSFSDGGRYPAPEDRFHMDVNGNQFRIGGKRRQGVLDGVLTAIAAFHQLHRLAESFSCEQSARPIQVVGTQRDDDFFHLELPQRKRCCVRPTWPSASPACTLTRARVSRAPGERPELNFPAVVTR